MKTSTVSSSQCQQHSSTETPECCYLEDNSGFPRGIFVLDHSMLCDANDSPRHSRAQKPKFVIDLWLHSSTISHTFTHPNCQYLGCNCSQTQFWTPNDHPLCCLADVVLRHTTLKYLSRKMRIRPLLGLAWFCSSRS